MKLLICATLAGLLLGGTNAAAPSPQGKNTRHAQQARANSDKDTGSDVKVSIHVVFAKADVVVLRNHYAPRYRNLPPGLHKKVARGGQLPPGWRKKFEPFPVAVERQLPSLPQGYQRGVIDGHAVIYNSRANVIVDVAVLF
jgi:hypothetical protein